MSAMVDSSSSETVVWDRFVRIGHWTLVTLFFIAYFTEDDLLALHTWAGYGVAAYVVARIVWGLVGTQHARFSDFLYAPGTAIHYLKNLIRFRATRYIGHSPAGAWMVFALLIGLAATGISGMTLLAVKENAGPLAGIVTTEAPALPTKEKLATMTREEVRALRSQRRTYWKPYEEAHELIANFTLALVILHIGGVMLASVAHNENLVRAMINGRKRNR